jgi:iron complex transport system ATP-binding protein
MQKALKIMEPPILDIRQVSYKIDKKLILDRISWQLQNGDRWVILGPNGAGKTTLLKIACGYIWPNSGGSIYRNGQTLVDLRELRRSIGWVTVSLTAEIPSDEIVTKTVISGKFAQLGLQKYAGQKLDGADAAQAHQYLCEMGCARLANQRFGTLSQGQKQRVLIARARMARPVLLVLDEPCAGLDPGGRELLLESIANLAQRQQQMGLVLVTQHVEEIMPVFEKVLALADGRVVENGPTEKVISSELISRLYRISARVQRSAGRYWMIRD